MEILKDLFTINALIMENADILEDPYGMTPEQLSSVSKVDKIVATFDALKEHADELNGAILQIFGSCAYLINDQGFHEKKAEAEPYFWAARDRLNAMATE